MKIDLILDGRYVEIDKDIDFVLNKQFTDLTDLTSIIVDYTKTIKVPMTPHNNELFNFVYKLSHKVLVGEDIITYDPSRKIPMIMNFNGSMVMEGYAVLNSIDLKAKMYELNLYGQLGKIFSILKDKTLANYSKDSSGFWKEIVMNTRTIGDSFANDHHNMEWGSTDWTDYFGFAPQIIGKSDQIDTKGYEVYGTGEVTKFADVINQTRNIDYGDVYVGDGLDFNQYCEMRTYMTRPYVYVDKLIRLVMEEVNNHPEEYDGYTFNLDDEWLNNENNPYAYDMVYFPGRESIVDDGNSVNGFVGWNVQQRYYTATTFVPTVNSSSLDGYTYSESGNVITVSGDSGASLTINGDGIIFKTQVTNCDGGSSWVDEGRWAYYHASDDNMSQVHIPHLDIYDGNDNLQYKLYLCDDTLQVMSDDGFLAYTWYTIPNAWSRLKALDHRVVVPTTCSGVNSLNGSTCNLTQTFKFGRISMNTNSFQFKFNVDLIDMSAGKVISPNCGFSAEAFLHPFKNDKYKNKDWNTNSAFSGYYTNPSQLDITSNTYRSMSRWTILDILGADFNPFKWLIDYAKKLRLVFDVFYDIKKIYLTGQYLSMLNFDPDNITVDYSKPVVIEPIVEKYNKVNFQYKDNESRKGVQYLKNYGVDYGDMDIYTGIDVSNDVLSLNPNKEDGVFIPVKADALTWTVLNSTYPLKYGNPLYTNRIINTLNKKGEIQYFPFYAFRWTNARNPARPNVPFYNITDDSPNMRVTGKYTYLDASSWAGKVEGQQDGVDVHYLEWLSFIPQFDNYIPKSIYNDEVGDYVTTLCWCTFAVPAEVYNESVQGVQYMMSIYDLWKGYLNEIFNVNNKKVTCYIRMSYPEFINFRFNEGFVIDGNLFLVNKIIDFNPNSTESTKVELIQIDNWYNLGPVMFG